MSGWPVWSGDEELDELDAEADEAELDAAEDLYILQHPLGGEDDPAIPNDRIRS